MDGEFSITLPSNVISKEDPNNTPAKFVTRLNKTIQLSGAWEVAATRLQLQNLWFNFPKSQKLGVYVRNLKTTSEDSYDAGTQSTTASMEQQQFDKAASQWKDASWATNAFVKNMNYRCVTFPAGAYTSIEHMGQMLTNQITLAFEDSFEDLELQYQYWDDLGGNVWIWNVEDGTTINLHVLRIVSLAGPDDLDVMEVLGFKPEFQGVSEDGNGYFKFFGGVQTPTKDEVESWSDQRLKHYCFIRNKVMDKPVIPTARQLMLYADVGALRSVGNIEAQLLDSVVVHAKIGEYEDALRGVTANYVPVYRNTFSTIEIELTDHAGERLRFPPSSSSPVIVTLRFRKVKSNK